MLTENLVLQRSSVSYLGAGLTALGGYFYPPMLLATSSLAAAGAARAAASRSHTNSFDIACGTD